MRSRWLLAGVLLCAAPLLTSCTAAWYGNTSIAKKGDQLVIVLRQCARSSDHIVLGESTPGTTSSRVIGEWKALTPVKAKRTVTLPLSVDPDPAQWTTVTSFADHKFAPDKVYWVGADGPNSNGSAGGELEEISADDITQLRPGTVLGAHYRETSDGSTDQDVVVQRLKTWVREADSGCDGNGWFS
jgi:hypothetical protein